ncbi:MAG: AMP-binding protein, partial [Pseudomonadota bacterium]
MTSPATVLDALFSAPGTARLTIDAGVHGRRVEMSHGELLDLGIQTAHCFAAWGVAPKDRVVFLLPTGIPLLRSILGCWLCGAIPVILPEAIETYRSDLGVERLRKILQKLSPRLVLNSARSQDSIDWAGEFPNTRMATCEQVTRDSPADHREPPYRPQGNDIALLQFSSGSTGAPKGCIIRHAQMVHNHTGLAHRGQVTSQGSDRTLIWAPLNHDMGFNATFSALLWGIDLVLIPTEAFKRSPYLWLQRISETRATFSAAPPSAYRALCRLASSRHLTAIDLSDWRYAVVGAEPVYPEHLAEFHAAYTHHGLGQQVLRPTYGMAETVIATTMLPPDEPAIRLYLDRDRLSTTGEVALVAPNHPRVLGLMACGYPLDGMDLRLVDGAGEGLGEDYQGHIQVCGPSVTEGYWGEPPRDPADWLDTGDLGFLHQGQIVISGRDKDIVIRGGRNHAANDLERVLEQAEPRRIKRAAVFSVLTGGLRGEEIVAAVEAKCPQCSPEDFLELESSLREAVIVQTDVYVDHLCFVPPGALPRTTSGKLQHHLARERYLAGTLPLGDSAPEEVASGTTLYLIALIRQLARAGQIAEGISHQPLNARTPLGQLGLDPGNARNLLLA